MRRAVCRLTSKELNKTVVDLIQRLDETGAASAGQATEEFLGQARGATRLWPDDEWVARMATTQPIYRALTRPRLRMLLEALEDDARSAKSEFDRCPRNLTVEHVMPQGWKGYWDDGRDDVAALRRDHDVQTLGNLTLVIGKLNGDMSNYPWTNDEAQAHSLGLKGKREALLDHSVLKLNAKLVAIHQDAWTDDDIATRGRALAERLTVIWPRPVAALANEPGDVAVADRSLEPAAANAADAEDESVTVAGVAVSGKYRPLYEWLIAQNPDITEIPVTFDDVEEILGVELPASAHNWMPYWYGDHSVGKVVRAGWRCSGVTLTGEKLTLVKDSQG